MRGRFYLAALWVAALLALAGCGPSEGAPVRPAVQPLLAAAAKPAKYVERSSACRTPGDTNRAGYCWYEGWTFTRKTICVDSSIAGAPLAEMARQFTGPGGLRVVVGGRAGECARVGYSAGQRVSFLSMTKAAAARYQYGVCGLTAPANYGNLSSVNITIYVTTPQATPCGAGAEWSDVFFHEFGHALGLSHEQAYVSSIMRDGNWPDKTDRAHLTQIYGGRHS